MADSNKTEQATPRHRQKAREQGRVTRSRELTSALSLFAVGGVLCLMVRQGAGHWTDFFRETLESANSDTIETNGPLLFWTSVEALRWIVPILAAGFVVSLAAGLAQGGFVVAPEALAVNFERLSPTGKLQQIFSPAGLSNILKSLIPFAGIGWVGVACLSSHWGQILGSSYAEPRAFIALIGSILFDLAGRQA